MKNGEQTADEARKLTALLQPRHQFTTEGMRISKVPKDSEMKALSVTVRWWCGGRRFAIKVGFSFILQWPNRSSWYGKAHRSRSRYFLNFAFRKSVRQRNAQKVTF